MLNNERNTYSSFIKKTENKKFNINLKVMKKSIIYLYAVGLFLVAATVTYAADPSDMKTNEVKVTEVDDLHLGNSIEKLWKVSFSKQAVPVTIAIRSVGDGTEYVVRSEFFEVIYANDKKGFGVRKIHNSLKEVPDPINYSVLNKEQMQQQRILTPEKVTDEVALGLIISYLPDLLNENYQHLIY